MSDFPAHLRYTAEHGAAIDDPALVNQDPYGAGWLLRVAVSGTGPLLSAEEYRLQVEP